MPFTYFPSYANIRLNAITIYLCNKWLTVLIASIHPIHAQVAQKLWTCCTGCITCICTTLVKNFAAEDLYFWCSVDYCLPPPLVNNAVARLNQTNRSVVITCMIGHRFSDGLTAHTYYCHADGTWDYDIPSCDGSCNEYDSIICISLKSMRFLFWNKKKS